MTVDELAQEIRRVDGSHSLGAGALAEALMPFILARLDKAETGWQDISTAPKDGTYVFVTNGVAQVAWVAKYVSERAFIENPWMSMMLNHWHSPVRYHSTIPTHWRPLPPSPRNIDAEG